MIKEIAIVGGCGHVGFPLGLAMASCGFHVKLIDINAKVITDINNGVIPFQEAGAAEILKNLLAENIIKASSDMNEVKDAQAVVFVTGTPVDEHLNPRINDVLKVIKLYAPFMNANQLIILRSTIFPGVFRVIDNLLMKMFKSPCKLAFCPERIVQGKGIEEIFNLPQLVSANSQPAFDEAANIFAKIAPKIIKLEPEEAELAKLMTNSWRYLEFAIANQFYMMVEERGYDFYKILNALADDYPRAKHFARAGFAAGPCLFKDTMQLSAFYNNKFFLGQAGMLINEGLPDFVVGQLERKMGGSLKDKKIALLGMSFKPDNDDTRESLSFKIKKVLEFKMAEVLIHDPYLENHNKDLDDILAQADGVILGTPHSEYRNLNIKAPYVDCWNVWPRD